MKSTLLIIIISCLTACHGHKTAAISKEVQKKPGIYFSDPITICDTCTTVILVHNEESTTSGDVSVDSGTVYISKAVLAKAHSLRADTDTAFVPHNMIALHELYFEEGKGYFRKLWKDTVNYRDLYKPFRLRGKIVDVYRRVLMKGDTEAYPALFFRLEKAEPIDTNYLKKVRKQIVEKAHK